MELIFWTIVFIISLIGLIKGADLLLEKSEKIGRIIKLSPFVIGVIFVGLGTSLPELTSSLMAVFKGYTQIVPANVIGSNIANILLIVGIASIIAGRLIVTKNLIDLELPLLALSTMFFFGVVWDGKIVLAESLFLLAFFGIYFSYIILHKDEKEEKKKIEEPQLKINKEKIKGKDILLLVVGAILLFLGAKFLIDSVVSLATILGVAVGVITLVAVAVGTSLPELIVSVKAALQKKSEIALGNIFGSNAFNLLLVIGLPGLFATLYLDSQTITYGLPFLAAATFLFIISGISRTIHLYEGAMFVIIYVFFIGKLFGFL